MPGMFKIADKEYFLKYTSNAGFQSYSSVVSEEVGPASMPNLKQATILKEEYFQIDNSL